MAVTRTGTPASTRMGMTEPDATALPRLLQLVSPTLPIGAYAYSEGLEYAVHAGWVAGEDTARAWILGRLEHGLATLDVPVLLRLYDAWDAAGHGPGLAAGHAARHAEALARVQRWNDLLHAFRDSAELRAADRDMGRSLARLLVSLGMDEAVPFTASPRVTHASMFALAAVRWRIPVDAAATGYGFAWLEGQVAAAIKLVPLGQSAGQRILLAAGARLPAMLARARALDDDELGATAPGLAIAASRHEGMYARLFRS